MTGATRLSDGGGLIPDPLILDGRVATARQRARYLQVAKATISVLRKYGYERTRVQTIASLSGVSLGTIYRYFTSREKLVYISVLDWQTRITLAMVPKPGPASLETRVIQFMRRAQRAVIAEPRLLEAWVRANLSSAPEITELVQKTEWPKWVMTFRDDGVVNPHLLDDLYLMTERVMISGMIRWAFGQRDFKEVCADAERVARLVFRAHAAPAVHPAQKLSSDGRASRMSKSRSA